MLLNFSNISINIQEIKILRIYSASLIVDMHDHKISLVLECSCANLVPYFNKVFTKIVEMILKCIIIVKINHNKCKMEAKHL